jgi:hypothetical protein
MFGPSELGEHPHSGQNSQRSGRIFGTGYRYLEGWSWSEQSVSNSEIYNFHMNAADLSIVHQMDIKRICRGHDQRRDTRRIRESTTSSCAQEWQHVTLLFHRFLTFFRLPLSFTCLFYTSFSCPPTPWLGREGHCVWFNTSAFALNTVTVALSRLLVLHTPHPLP